MYAHAVYNIMIHVNHVVHESLTLQHILVADAQHRSVAHDSLMRARGPPANFSVLRCMVPPGPGPVQSFTADVLLQYLVHPPCGCGVRRELSSASFRGTPRRETRRKSRGIAVCVPIRIGLLCMLLAASELGEHALDRLETGDQAGLLHSLYP